MNPVQRFFRRYIFSTIGILALFFLVNLLLILSLLISGCMSGAQGGLSVQALSGHVTRQNGVWTADGAAVSLLRENEAWAMLLNESGTVVWEQDLPQELPRAYTSAQVASFSRWYLQDYPVKVWAREDGGLMVVGFAPGSWVKYYFSMETPALLRLLAGAVVVFAFNLLLMVFLMLRNTRRVEKAMSPILQGIQDLGRGRHRALEEKGELAEISAGLNRAGDYLLQKDNTRAEWIRGVSHDICTPLSMVLGYASQLEDDSALPPEARRQAGMIRRQGERLRALVEDLNLTTRLEYALTPLRREKTDLVEVGRQAVSGVLNGGLPQQYELEFSEEHPGRAAQLSGDPALLRRMLDNLIRNSMVHNPQGCRISVTVSAGDGQAACTVADDGGGMEAAACEAMNQRQDVFPLRGSAGGGEHGMGLRLVRQIAQAHGGTVRFEPAEPHGLRVKITFPTGGAA